MSISAFQNIKNLTPGDHLCCIYRKEDEHRQVITMFVRLGLQAGHKVMYIVDIHTAEAVIGYLREEGVDIDSYRESGQFQILTGHDTYTREEHFDPDAMIELLRSETEKALEEGYDALRVTGEMTWALRDVPGTERLIEYENKLNTFIPNNRCIAICQYDKNRFSPTLLMDVLRTHPYAIIGTEIYRNFYYLPPETLLGDKSVESELELWIQNLRENALAEQALQESEERYRNLYNSIRDAILVVDVDNHIIHCNRAFIDLFGYSFEEVLDEEYSYISEEGHESVNVGEKLEKSENSEILFTTDYRKKNGEHFFGETKVYALTDNEGHLDGYIALIRDITEKKRFQEDLQREKRFVDAILETSGALIVIISPEGNIVRMNETCKKVTGYSEDEFKRISLWELIPQEEQYQAEEIFSELVKGNYPNTHENHWITRDGEKRFVAWTNTVVPDGDGKVESIISAGIDITEQRREMESKVEKLEAEISRMERFSTTGSTHITGRMYVQKSFRESSPKDSSRLQEEYETILEARMEEKIYKTDNMISYRLRDLAQKLGMADVGPKDVMELHVHALKKISSGVNFKRAQALSEEGRLLALELMGYIVSYYRNQVSAHSGIES